MKKLNTNLKYILLLFLVSCGKQKIEYSHILYDKDILNLTSLATIDKPEKVLLTMYLYAYGNPCDNKKILKCAILEVSYKSWGLSKQFNKEILFLV